MNTNSNPTYNFKDQVALVTGASTGIGFATTKAFAEAGASVVLADINEEKLNAAVEELKNQGHCVLAIKCDVTDEKQVKAMVEQTVSTLGRLDMAFNNAGISGPSGPFLEETADSYDNVQAVNMRGVWNCMQHELGQMSKQGNGAIVNCSSLGGLVGQTGRAAYHATKHGVIGLTKSVGLEYAPLGIRVNAVCPGVVDTPMLGSLKEISVEAMEKVLKDQPIDRLGEPGEIAAAVLWLSSAAASFVVATALSVDGGFTAN